MTKVRCPHCGKETLFSADNPHRPFCSERCQLLDLGNWAEGRYSIPTEPGEVPPTQLDENPNEDNDHSADGRVLH